MDPNSPKGVMVSYKAMTETVFGLIEITKTTSEDRYLSYLPISHGMERWVGQCVPYVSGMQVFYAEALTTFVADLNRCRPTLFVSVPRLWTKVGEAISYAAKPEAAIRNSTSYAISSKLSVPTGRLQERAASEVGEATQDPSH